MLIPVPRMRVQVCQMGRENTIGEGSKCDDADESTSSMTCAAAVVTANGPSQSQQ